MHFMLQKEVVDRMCATADDDAYGRLSVALAARCEVAHLFNVGPGAFSPPPKVDSAIVRLKPRTPDFVIDNRSEEHTSELQSLMRISYDVFCLKKKNTTQQPTIRT